jgi:hypothetical protein
MPVTDDDLTALAAASRPVHQECGAHFGLRSLPPDTRALMLAAMANPAANHQQLEDAFARRGLDVDWQAISRHRRGKCKCARCNCGGCV